MIDAANVKHVDQLRSSKTIHVSCQEIMGFSAAGDQVAHLISPHDLSFLEVMWLASLGAVRVRYLLTAWPTRPQTHGTPLGSRLWANPNDWWLSAPRLQMLSHGTVAEQLHTSLHIQSLGPCNASLLFKHCGHVTLSECNASKFFSLHLTKVTFVVTRNIWRRPSSDWWVNARELS